MITKHQELHAMMCAAPDVEKIVEKMKQVDMLAEKDRFDLGFDPTSETYYCPSFKLFFEDQESAVMAFIRKNGYSLLN